MATSAIAHPVPAATGSVHTLRIFRKETKYEFLKLMRTKSFSLSTIGFPVMFYVLFGIANRNAFAGNIHIAKYMLGGYACFGLIGAALFGIGVGVASELAAGWLELKRASPMPASAYLFAKCASAVAFGLIIVCLLTVIATGFGGVSLSAIELVKMLGMTIVGSISFAEHGSSSCAACAGKRRSRPSSTSSICPCRSSAVYGCRYDSCRTGCRASHPRYRPIISPNSCSSIFGYGDSMSLATHWNALIGFTLLMLGLSWLIFHRKEQNA